MVRRIDKQAVREGIERVMGMALDPETTVEMADRYVEVARRISMKSRVRIPRHLKHFICRGCKRALIPGATARFRTTGGRDRRLTVTCLRCGHIYRKGLHAKAAENVRSEIA